MIAFPCPKCQATLKAPDDKIGARSKCPRCGTPVEVSARLKSQPLAGIQPVKPQSAPAPLQWHYSRDGKLVGPLLERELNEAIGLGELRLQDQVWRQGFPQWEPA